MVLSDDHEDLYGLDPLSSESINTQIRDDHEDLYGLERPNSESINTQISDDVNTSLQLKNRSVSSDSDESGRSKRPRTSSESNSEDADLIGLTLSKTPSFLNLIESELSQAKRRVGRPSNSSRNKSTTEDFAISEKLKAANFPAIKLTIGAWKRVTKHEGDLIAKCYYAKRKLVWELLDGPLKSKIEIQWSDIIALRAITPHGDLPGILELELNQPPTFYRETNPQPRKHTLWQQTSDFTGGQAPIHRRHCVSFPPGVLDKHYEKLLLCDPRLNELSKQPFPSQLYPYFDQPQQQNEVSDFSFGNDYGSQLFLKMQYPHHLPAASSTSSTALFPDLRMHNNSTMTAPPLQPFSSSFPVSGENISNYAHINEMSTNVGENRNNYAHINPMSGLWGGQGPNELVNVAMGNQTIGMLPASSTTPQANWVVPTEDHQAMYPQNDSMENNQERLVLNYIKNHLLNDNQVTSYDEPIYSFPEHHANTSLDATGDLHDLNSSYQTMNNYAEDVAPNNETTYAQQMTWTFPQETNDGFSTNYPTQDVNQEVESVQEARN